MPESGRPLDHGHREPRQVRLVEEPQREALLGAGFRRQPVVGDRAQLAHDRRHAGRFDDAEHAAVLFQPAKHLPVLGGLSAFEGERRQIDLRLLAELHERQPEVGVPMQMRSGHFVEDRHAAEVVAALEKQAHQIGEPILRPDRIAQRHPGASLDAVHDEGGAFVVEQQRLVPEKREVGKRRRLGGNRLRRIFEIRLGRGRRLVRGVPNQARKPKQQEHDRRTDRRTQEPRRVALQLELPPELVRILHVLERKEPEPHGRAERADHGRDPGS